MLDYALPDGAVRGRLGNSTTRSGYTYQNIFPPGTDLKSRRVGKGPESIGYEEFYEGHLVEQVLFRKHLRFGIARKWHFNGQLASEEPYRDGVMDGLFRQWDDQGRLVAQYVLRNGGGTKRIFNSSGELVCEEHLAKEGKEGWCTAYIEMQGGRRWLSFFVENRAIGIVLDFDRDWHVIGVSWHSKDLPEPKLHGPEIRFMPDGKVVSAKWYLNGKKVTEAEYVEAVAKDPNLPPYYVDTQKYREVNDSEARAMVLHYKNLPRVKIPLEFDAQGNPMPAEASR